MKTYLVAAFLLTAACGPSRGADGVCYIDTYRGADDNDPDCPCLERVVAVGDSWKDATCRSDQTMSIDKISDPGPTSVSRTLAEPSGRVVALVRCTCL